MEAHSPVIPSRWQRFWEDQNNFVIIPLAGLVALLSLGAILLWQYHLEQSFNSKFKSGQISFNGSQIGLGQVGHPTVNKSSFPGYMPGFDEDVSKLSSTPHRVTFGRDLQAAYPLKCLDVQLNGFKTLHASTTFAYPQLITISMPVTTQGLVHICAPYDQGLAPVVAWGS